MFAFIFVLLILIATLHNFALANFLYWKFWWYDIMMHFLGGLWIGLVALWICFYSGYIKKFTKTNRNYFFVSLLSVILVGVGWEIFEFLIDSNILEGYFFDTITDIIMDIAGGIFAFLYFKRLRIKNYDRKI